MAHASKSFIVFTGGEWSEQLHGRTDLAKADSAGRKVRNFVPAQTGRLSRRKGLEFVGAALGECLAGDPRFMIPEWSSLDVGATIDPTIDPYGSIGPEELRTSDEVGPIWQVCANIQYCYGPTEEGATMQNIGDRYCTRWVAKLDDGKVFYRRVGTGEDWTQVPDELIPQPNDTLNGIGFCFDANAKPCFASAIGDDIHVWRWVAGTPTEYSFPGQGPRLFFNGVLQWDNGYWDVMCYFCWNGDLVAAFQRENFATNYTLFTSEDHYLTRVCYLDRGIGEEDSERIYIAVTGNSGLYGMFRSPPYDPWPFVVDDSGTHAVAIDSIDYYYASTDCGTYIEQAPAFLTIDGIDYLQLTVAIDQPTEQSTVESSIESIAYPEVVILAGTYTETGTHSANIENISYPAISVNAGTYTESATQNNAIEVIDYATA